MRNTNMQCGILKRECGILKRECRILNRECGILNREYGIKIRNWLLAGLKCKAWSGRFGLYAKIHIFHRKDMAFIACM